MGTISILRRRVCLMAVLAIGVTPVSLSACPVCFSAKGESRVAYYATTVLLLSTPAVLVGSFVILLRRRLKKMSDAETAGDPSSAPGTSKD